MDIFTAPWPGPGNSEGPVDPEGWSAAERHLPDDQGRPVKPEPPFVVSVPWPGPGDSDGSLEVWGLNPLGRDVQPGAGRGP